MIQTVTIDIINENAMNLLQDLELLQLIRVHKDKVGDKPEKLNWITKYKGSISKQPIKDIDDQLNQLRNQWE